jgi:hypothetical protein
MENAQFALTGGLAAVLLFLIWFWNSLYVIKEWERGVVLPKSGVKFAVFVQISPKSGGCYRNLCSSRSVLTKVDSAFQRF